LQAYPILQPTPSWGHEKSGKFGGNKDYTLHGGESWAHRVLEGRQKRQGKKMGDLMGFREENHCRLPNAS